jgi:hypothetical protein
MGKTEIELTESFVASHGSITIHALRENSPSKESPKSHQGRKRFSAVPAGLNLSFHHIPSAKALGYFQRHLFAR